MGFAKIHGHLTTRIGEEVHFSAPKYPANAKLEVGTIIDEVWADQSLNCSPPQALKEGNDWGDYSFFAQLIRWKKEPVEFSIRLGYYRSRPTEDFWEFAGQMTICADWHHIKTLLDSTLAKSWWFADNPQKPNAAST